MASKNERQRWDDMYRTMQSRLERQKASITRLTLIMTEANAALMEIADGDLVESGMKARARDAIARMTRLVSGNGENQEESEGNQDPTPTEEVSNDGA